jgi:hypothetical protein
MYLNMVNTVSEKLSVPGPSGPVLALFTLTASPVIFRRFD